jgi:hypothetical protein
MGRNYRSTMDAKSLLAGMNISVTTMELNNIIGIPAYPFTMVIEPDTANEEIVTVSSLSAGTTVNVVRGQDGSSAVSHDPGSTVRHMITARDLQEPQDHIVNTTTAHGATGAVVGTTNAQTLTNKTLTSPIINNGTITGGTIATATLTTPTIASFGNANHSHVDSGGGGVLASGSYYPTVDAAKTGSHTLVLGDAGKVIRMDVATANNLIVPTNSVVAFPIGTVITLVQVGAGQTTISGAGVTFRSESSKFRLKAQFAVAGLVKINTDEWVVYGNLVA